MIASNSFFFSSCVIHDIYVIIEFIYTMQSVSTMIEIIYFLTESAKRLTEKEFHAELLKLLPEKGEFKFSKVSKH